jgi:hypothetical protein
MSSPGVEAEVQTESVTPVKAHFQVTPPTTARASRSKKDVTIKEAIATDYTQLHVPEDDHSPSVPSTTGSIRAGMSSPFDQWSRSKSTSSRAVSASKGTKREGEPLVNGDGGGGKRTRSAAYSGSV